MRIAIYSSVSTVPDYQSLMLPLLKIAGVARYTTPARPLRHGSYLMFRKK